MDLAEDQKSNSTQKHLETENNRLKHAPAHDLVQRPHILTLVIAEDDENWILKIDFF